MHSRWSRTIAATTGLVLLVSVTFPAGLTAIRAAMVLLFVAEATRFIRENGKSARHLHLARASVLVGLGGAVVRAIHGAMTGTDYPFPSPADALGYLFYAYLVAAGVTLVRARTRENNTEDWLDAALVGVIALSAQYCFVIDTYLFDETVPVVTRLVNAGFAVATTCLVVVAARMSFGPGAKNGSYYCLAGAVAVALVNDVALQLQAAGSANQAWLTAVLAPLGIMFMVASVQHPGVVHLDDRPRSVVRRFDRRRQMLSAGAVIYGLVLVAWTANGTNASAMVVALVAAAVGIGVLGWRTRLFLEDGREAVLLEQRLRAFTTKSAEMSSIDGVNESAARLVSDIVPSALAGRIQIIVAESPEACLDEVHRLPSIVASGASNGTVDAGGQTLLILEDVELDGVGRRGCSVAAVVDLSRSSSCTMLYVEASGLITQRALEALEALVVQLGLLHRGVHAVEASHVQRSNQRFSALVQDSSDVVAVVNRESLLVEFVSPTLRRMVGYTESQALGGSPLAAAHPEDRAKFERRLEAAVGRIEIEPTDIRVQHKNGQFHWFSLAVRDLSDESEVSGLLFSYVDIHDRKMTELQMVAAEARYRALVTNSNDVMLLLKDEVITYLTPNVERVFGFRAADLIGARASVFLDERGDYEVDQLFADGSLIHSGSDTVVELPTADGGTRWAQLTFLDPGLDDDEVMISVRDVTEQRRLEVSLREQAIHDPLTGLFNRASVYHELQKSFQRLEPGMHLAVLHLDVQDFKSINDSLGFRAGDALLVEIATRLRAVLRRSDVLARFNGDEFAIITTGSATEHLDKLVDRLSAAFDEPFDVAGRSVPVAVVTGAAIAEDRAENATRLLESAGIALQYAKATKQELVVFEEAMREAASERFELASGMLEGLERNEFFVVYQPLLNLGTQKVSSTEALLRWHHPVRGFVSPAAFIPLAEQSGAIIELGRWVLRQACEQLVDWHANVPDGEGLSMSVNVSALQLEVEGEADRLLDIIRASGVDTKSLILELTESVMLDDAAALRSMLEDFRDLGIRVAVDDFGTGAAGLSHLRDVPFDIVKIDKTYIDGLGTEGEDHPLITGVIELAHGFNAKIVAEGIETPIQASLLRSMQCDYGQGFYLGHPMEPAQIVEWFARGRAGSAAASIAPLAEKGTVVPRLTSARKPKAS